ncbi:hypothetical protein D3C76_1024450 [compost metagenome]
MAELKEHGRLIRQFLKAARELQALGVADNIESKTLAELQNELVSRSSPGAGFKQAFPRHGARWEDEEKQRLIELSEAGNLDVDAFANEYQRRPESVITCMVRLGLIDKSQDIR